MGKARNRFSRLAYSIKRLSREADVGRTMIYAEIAAGRLIASKVGRHTIITRANALRWLRSLRTIGFDQCRNEKYGEETGNNVEAFDDDMNFNGNANDNDNNDDNGLYIIKRGR